MSGIDEGVLGTCPTAVAPSSGVPQKGTWADGKANQDPTLCLGDDVSACHFTTGVFARPRKCPKIGFIREMGGGPDYAWRSSTLVVSSSAMSQT